MQATYDISIGRACRLTDLHRSMWYYESRRDDSEVIDKLSELAEKLPTRGFDEYYGRIRNEGLQWNRKRVLRVYRLMQLNLRRKRKRRLPARTAYSVNTGHQYRTIPDTFLEKNISLNVKLIPLFFSNFFA